MKPLYEEGDSVEHGCGKAHVYLTVKAHYVHRLRVAVVDLTASCHRCFADNGPRKRLLWTEDRFPADSIIVRRAIAEFDEWRKLPHEASEEEKAKAEEIPF